MFTAMVTYFALFRGNFFRYTVISEKIKTIEIYWILVILVRLFAFLVLSN